MTCSRGDIVLVPFPFADLSAAKKRPVLILTEPDTYGDFLAVAVTSRSHHVHAVEVTKDDLAGGGLPVTSWVRVDRLVTLNLGLCIKPLAQVREEYIGRVVAAICRRIGYSG